MVYMDLELMFSSIISLRTANWNKWTKLFTDLLALSTGITYSLALFIRLGGFIYWIYLSIDFIYSILLLYLLDLPIGFSFNVYTIHYHSNLIQIFSQLRKEHQYISLTIHISRSHRKNLPLSVTSSLVLN